MAHNLQYYDLYSDMKEIYRSRWTSSALFSRFIDCRMSLSWEMSVPKEHAAMINRRTQYTWPLKYTDIDTFTLMEHHNNQ